MEYDSTDSDSEKATVNAELIRIRQMRAAAAAAAAAEAFRRAAAAISEAEGEEIEGAWVTCAAEETTCFLKELKRRIEEDKARPADAAPRRGKRRRDEC